MLAAGREETGAASDATLLSKCSAGDDSGSCLPSCLPRCHGCCDTLFVSRYVTVFLPSVAVAAVNESTLVKFDGSDVLSVSVSTLKLKGLYIHTLRHGFWSALMQSRTYLPRSRVYRSMQHSSRLEIVRSLLLVLYKVFLCTY